MKSKDKLREKYIFNFYFLIVILVLDFYKEINPTTVFVLKCVF